MVGVLRVPVVAVSGVGLRAGGLRAGAGLDTFRVATVGDLVPIYIEGTEGDDMRRRGIRKVFAIAGARSQPFAFGQCLGGIDSHGEGTGRDQNHGNSAGIRPGGRQFRSPEKRNLRSNDPENYERARHQESEYPDDQEAATGARGGVDLRLLIHG